ncbi:uncharacterized protein LOC119403087 [Rhipicephalus sanguineus]|uniref:uncharacterized protein LOC119403087 n=1 Tax=Rhipicephalus sanguineus TaxID=34632 RepID=UPI0020C1E9BF|nr:uncharacterized protein LOC119403087 [Rhipicephalus sanguineus]
MAGVQGSYHDPDSSGPEESLSGCSVKVTLKDGRQLPCKLHAGNTGNLPRCINCGFFMITWAKLKCRHSLCGECFNKSLTYICPIDNARIDRFQASTGTCEYDGTLKDILTECPLCGRTELLSSIVNHIEKAHPIIRIEKSRTPQNMAQEQTELGGNKALRNHNHSSSDGRNPELSNLESTKPLQGVPDTKTVPTLKHDKTEPRSKEEHHDYNLASSDGRGREFSNNEESKPPAPVIEAKREHEEAPYRYFIECPICKIKVNFNNFRKHKRLCQGQDCGQREASFGVKQGDDGTEEQYLDDEIRELKHRVKVLEGRLESMEQPLLALLRRLYKNP